MIRVVQVGPHTWALQSGFSKALLAACKMTPGMTYDGKNWVGYADAAHATIGALRHFGAEVQGEPGRPVGMSIIPTASLRRDYQDLGVTFILSKGEEGCILADDVGLGKSSQAITAARAIKQKTVVVCPSFVRDVWLNPKGGEIKKWWPIAKAFGPKGLKPSPIDGLIDVVVVHYDILYAWVDELIKWGAVFLIIDEGHYLMGSRSRRTQAAQKLALACRYRVMLTATPMTSRPRDMWAPIETISPGRVGKFFNFGIRYAGGHQVQVSPTKVVWDFKGASNLGELRERLLYSKETPWGFMLRRTRSDVALELPSRTRQFIEMDIPKGRLMATSSAIRSDRVMRKALDMAADGKFPQVIELVCNHLGEGSNVVVGCHRKAIAEMIAEAVNQQFHNAAKVFHGEVSQKDRQAIIDKPPKLLACTIDATKAGINLSFANVAVVAELIWVPADLLQWEGRFARYQGSSVLIQYCLANRSADGLIKRAVLDKLDKFAQSVGKTDDKMAEEMRALSKEGASERFRKLYERMKKEDDE